MEMDGEMFCFVHEGGDLIRNNDGPVEYKGGRTKSIVLHRGITFRSLVDQIRAEMRMELNSFGIYFTVKFDLSCMMPLEDDSSVAKMLRFNETHCRVYLAPITASSAVAASTAAAVANEEIINITSPVGVYSAHGESACVIASTHRQSASFIGYHGSSSRCAEVYSSTLEVTRYDNAVMGSGQIFSSASKFRDAVYLMSLAGRFKYKFKKNSLRHMTVVCSLSDCRWKITCRAVGNSKIVQVHTFDNTHNHSLDDTTASVPAVRPSRSSGIIDSVIQSAPDYLPGQICKDFVRDHGLSISYNQAWHLKEKAKERLFGVPYHYYKMLPWMCERIIQANPGSIVKYANSEDGHFEQLFVAYSISIQGFAAGCRPIIAIDLSHMSGPYGGALFSAAAYDADDLMFPLAFGVAGSENYDDWLWFLENLRAAVGGRDVVVVSDRLPALLRAVPQLFGAENHAYCYRHLRESFGSHLGKHNIKGRKGKENALELLDGVAYARLDRDYGACFGELRKFNEDLAAWVESNEPEHWAISKFPKKRWDKMALGLAGSFNSWLRVERHYSICSFLMEHMAKLGEMLAEHKEEAGGWKADVGPKVEGHVLANISKGRSLRVSQLVDDIYGVFVGSACISVDVIGRECACRGWQMLGIPCEHACAVLLSTGQHVIDYVDDWYRSAKQDLIYSGSFSGIDTRDMPSVCDDGVVRDLLGKVHFSLLPPNSRRAPGRPRKKRAESLMTSRRTVYCSICNREGHNRKTCQISMA